MPTIKQKKAVIEVMENHGNVSKAMRAVGYTNMTAKNPKNLTDSKGYQEEMKPVLEQYQKELQAILKAMKRKNKNTEEYRTLITASDTVQKQIQLLSGGSTDNVLVVTWEK